MPKEKEVKEGEQEQVDSEEREDAAAEETEDSAEEQEEAGDKEAGDEEEKDSKPREKYIPRERFDELNEEKKELESRVAKLEQRLENSPELQQQREKLINDWAQRMSDSYGKDELGNPKVPVETVKAIVQISQDIGKKDPDETDREVRIHQNIDVFERRNPDLKEDIEKFRDDIAKSVKNLGAASQVHPKAVEDSFWVLYGKGRKQAEMEAKKQGKEAGKNQRRISSSIQGDKPVSAGQSKITDYGSKLSADEKRVADDMKISYKDYYDSKGKKSVPIIKRSQPTRFRPEKVNE